MSGGRQTAKLAGGRPLDGGVRRLVHGLTLLPIVVEQDDPSGEFETHAKHSKPDGNARQRGKEIAEKCETKANCGSDMHEVQMPKATRERNQSSIVVAPKTAY
jgi:hypothetical protein